MDKRNLVIGITIVSVLGMAGISSVFFVVASQGTSSSTSSSSAGTTSSSTTTSTTYTPSGRYGAPPSGGEGSSYTTVDLSEFEELTDGTYSTTVAYTTHHHSESIGVTVTIENGIITNVETDHSENDNRSIEYQEGFAAAIDDLVEGQSLNEVSVSRVAGASDTTNAFMQALQDIANEAA